MPFVSVPLWLCCVSVYLSYRGLCAPYLYDCVCALPLVLMCERLYACDCPFLNVCESASMIVCVYVHLWFLYLYMHVHPRPYVVCVCVCVCVRICVPDDCVCSIVFGLWVIYTRNLRNIFVDVVTTGRKNNHLIRMMINLHLNLWELSTIWCLN